MFLLHRKARNLIAGFLFTVLILPFTKMVRSKSEASIFGMTKYRKLSRIFYYCIYYIVWPQKYRFRVLKDIVADAVEDRIKAICEWKEVEVPELNAQLNHVHLVCSIPPKMGVSEFMEILKGKTAIMLIKSYTSSRQKP